MSSVDSDALHEPARDRDSLVLKNQHAIAENGLGRSVPMWDSSDPDRAPPPLPMNPTSSSPIIMRAGTSAHIAETARLLHDKARESLPSSYTTNIQHDRSLERSPERSLIKGAQHRRLQSLQTSSVKDLRSYLDGAKSPERPSSHSRTPTSESLPSLMGSSDRRDSRLSTPTPSPSSKRPPPKAILGEDSVPSPTMLALQTLAAKELPESKVDSDKARDKIEFTIRSPPLLSAIDTTNNLSSQMAALTSIATSLQKEMQNLARRSKDNATDLVALKAATNARDEDIRKSLRELVLKSNENPASTRAFGIPFLDGDDLERTPRGGGQALPLPKFSSPHAQEDGRAGSPMPYEREAGIAMLEKIIRDMVTKEGQDSLLIQLSTLMKKAEKESSGTAQKVTELVEFIKNSGNSRALVKSDSHRGHQPPQLGGLSFDQSALPGPLTVTKSESPKPYSSPRAADFVTNDIVKMLKKMMESLRLSGGTVNEVKTQQYDLRREVLVMGRELGAKIERLHYGNGVPRSIEDGTSTDITAIIEQQISALKEHLENVMREKRRQSSSTTISRASVDNREVYDLVKHALAQQDEVRPHSGALQLAPADKDAILHAVKEACEEFKPEIELQQFGLERDEILQCLKEGLQDYRKHDSGTEGVEMQRQEIFEAVQEAMTGFRPPAPINEMQELRDEMLETIRETLEQLRPGETESWQREAELTRNVLVDVVKDTMRAHGPNAPQELSINREDLFDAVRNGLEARGTPFGRYGEQIVNQLNEMLEDMRTEFKNYSTANGRDTEQVLDAMKDGLESLRGDIESYVDHSQDVTGKSEIIDALRSGLENLRVDVQGYVGGPRAGDVRLDDLLSYIKSEFEHLHEVMQDGPARDRSHGTLLSALHAGFESIRTSDGTRGLDGERGVAVRGDLSDDVHGLRDTILAGAAGHRDDILDTLNDGFRALQTRLDNAGVSGGNDLDIIKEEIEHLRSTIASTMVDDRQNVDTNVIVGAVREAISHGPGSGSEHDAITRETIEAIHDNVIRLQTTVAGNAVAANAALDTERVVQIVRDGLQDLKTSISAGGLNTELAEALHGEFENLRQSIGNSVALNGGRGNNDEVLDAVRLGLDDLQSHIDKKIENPDRTSLAHGEFLDALNDGLEGLRADVFKVMDKPVDMTVSYEILDTLKGGISELRAEMDKLKGKGDKRDTNRAGNEIVLADGSDVGLNRDVHQEDLGHESIKRDDISKLEIMLAQLQIKVEAMDANVQMSQNVSAAAAHASENALSREDVRDIVEMIKELQTTLGAIEAKESMGDIARKEDTDAIETLLRNTKAQFDECLPNPENVVTREHIETIDSLVRESHDKLELIKNLAAQTDVAVVEVLIKDANDAIADIKNTIATYHNDDNKVEKKHIDTLGHVCMEIKNKLEEIKLPDAETLPTKTELKELQVLLGGFFATHDKWKDGYEADIAITAKAFDDRKREADELLTSVALVKTYLEETKYDLVRKVEEANTGVGTIFSTVKDLETSVVAGFGVSEDVKTLSETMTTEFEKTQTAIQFLKEAQQEKIQDLHEKSEERRITVVSDVTSKLDEHFSDLMSRYDEAQVQAELHAKNIEEKAAETTFLLSGNKEMAEELRLTIDTLGSAMTAMQSSFDETRSKISDEANFKILYEKIDEVCAKTNEATTENKVEGQLTRDTLRDEVAKAVTSVNDLQGEVTEYHPRFMLALEEIRALVHQHYDHSQQANETARETARTAMEDAKTQAEEIKSSFSNLPALMPAVEALPAPLPRDFLTPEKFDDSSIQVKLDSLMLMLSEPRSSTAQLDRLDKIHEQVNATAAEVSAFVASQTRLITERQDTHESEVDNMRSVLERRRVEKEQIEADIARLAADRTDLTKEVEELRINRDGIVAEKNQLSRDMTAIQTALEIRREELRLMQSKADELHERMLQGLMDQSRALLIARAKKGEQVKAGHKMAPTPQRVTSTMSHSTIASLPQADMASRGFSTALKLRPAIKRNSQAGSNGQTDLQKARRIMSLSQINGNANANVRTYLGPNMNPQPGNLTNTVKRSHSVKSQWPRKSSWNADKYPQSRVVSVSEADEDKENAGDDQVVELERASVAPSVADSFTANEESVVSVSRRVSTSSAASRDSSASPDRRMSSSSAAWADAEETIDSDASQVEHSDAADTSSESDVTETGSRRSSNGTIITGGGESEVSYDHSSYLSGTDCESDMQSNHGSSAITTGAALGQKSELESQETVTLKMENDVEGLLNDEQTISAKEAEDEPTDLPLQIQTNFASGMSETETHIETQASYPTKQFVVFNTPAPSDSGLGSDLHTANIMSGSETDYFRRMVEDETSTLSDV